MVTAFITIKPHVAAYAKVIFKVEGKNYIQIPHRNNLYHIILNLMQKLPENVSLPRSGNLEIALPAQSRGKSPLHYCFLSEPSAKIINKKLEAIFFAHLLEFIQEHQNLKHLNENETPIYYIKDCIYMFVETYNIEGITISALEKSYSRWKKKREALKPKKNRKPRKRTTLNDY